MAGNNYVFVQLTVAGAQFAGGHPMRISNGRRTFLLTPGQPLRVEYSYEWLAVLSKQHTPKGDALCELVATPVVAAAVPAAPVVPVMPAKAAESEPSSVSSKETK